MAKQKSKTKKIIKVILGVITFFTLPSLLAFGFLFLKYNEPLPEGVLGEKADALAHKMLNALNHENYQNTNYLEWTFNKRHHYKWQKNDKMCEVMWKSYRVKLNLKDYSRSKAYINRIETKGKKAEKLIQKAIRFYNNDSFWLVAPYKVFDKGVQRRLVTLKDNKEALLVTYTSGGSTPGDSYLWLIDETGKPKSFKMWTSILPIDGLEASWSDWIITESGAQLPKSHKLLFFTIDMGEVKGSF